MSLKDIFPSADDCGCDLAQCLTSSEREPEVSKNLLVMRNPNYPFYFSFLESKKDSLSKTTLGSEY